MNKVEKCPKCKCVPDVARTSRWYGWWIFHVRIRGYIRWEDHYQCYKRDFFSLTENGVYRKWNRWVRRERKEGANQCLSTSNCGRKLDLEEGRK